MDQPTRGTEAGISLVEVMAASTLAMVMLTAISSATTSQTRLRRVAEERNLAMVAARNTLEEIRNTDFTSLPSLDGRGFDVSGANGGAGGLRPIPGDADDLPGRISVSTDQSSSGETLYMVTVSVDWDGNSGPQHLSFRSLVAQRK
ncbi:MAG: hypothetical protein R3F56_16540 [Planctomycetota bacterium]